LAFAAVRCSNGYDPGADRQLEVLVRQLEVRDSFYRRVVCRWISRAVPAAAASFPKLFNPDAGPANRRRLAAHEALLALGEKARPALPRLAQSLAHEDPVVRTYALVVVAHLHPDEREFMRWVRAQPRGIEVPVRHLCGVLRDEDERLRDFAWGCLQAAGPIADLARPALTAIRDDPTAEPALRTRALRTIECLTAETVKH
jgi:hypothetical protein